MMAIRAQLRINEDGDLEKRCRKCGEWWPAEVQFWRKSRGCIVSPCMACTREAEDIPAKRPAKWTEELIRLMYAEYQSGLTLEQVARTHGTDKHYLGVLFKQYGLKTRGRRAARILAKGGPSRTYSREFVEMLHRDYQTGLSAKNVDRKHSLKFGVTAYLFYRDGLPMRKRSDAVADYNQRRRLSGDMHPWQVDDEIRFSQYYWLFGKNG